MNVLYCAVSALYYCLLINTITTTICIYNKLTSLTTPPLPSPPHSPPETNKHQGCRGEPAQKYLVNLTLISALERWKNLN